MKNEFVFSKLGPKTFLNFASVQADASVVLPIKYLRLSFLLVFLQKTLKFALFSAILKILCHLLAIKSRTWGSNLPEFCNGDARSCCMLL